MPSHGVTRKREGGRVARSPRERLCIAGFASGTIAGAVRDEVLTREPRADAMTIPRRSAFDPARRKAIGSMRRSWPLLFYVAGFACTFLDRVPRWSESAWCSLAGIVLAGAGVALYVGYAMREGRRAFGAAALVVTFLLVVGGALWYPLQKWVPAYDPIRDACSFLVERGFTARRAWWLGSGMATAFEKDGILLVATADESGFDAAFSDHTYPETREPALDVAGRDARIAELRKAIAGRTAPNYPFAAILRLDPASARALADGLVRCERVPRGQRRAAHSALLAELLRRFGAPCLEGDFRRLAPLDSAYVGACREELARLESEPSAPGATPTR